MTFEYSTKKLLKIYSSQIDEHIEDYIKEYNPICQSKIREAYTSLNKRLQLIKDYITNNIDVLIADEYFCDDKLDKTDLKDLIQIQIEKDFSEKELLPVPNETITRR